MFFSISLYRVIGTLFLLLVMGCEKNQTAKAPEVPRSAQKADQGEDKAKPVKETATNDLNLKTLGKRYENNAKALITSIDNKAASEAIKGLGTQLTQTGLAMIPLLTEKYPACASYFDALKKASQTFASLSLEAIEKDYHQDGKLPKSPDGSCYHGKDLVVHPATVVIMAQTGIETEEQKVSARHEIEEVLAHLSAVLQ